MSDILVPVAIAGGAYFVLSRQGGPVGPPGNVAYGSPIQGATLGDGLSIPNGQSGYDPYLDNSGQTAFNIDGRSNDPDAMRKVDLLDSAMQSAYNKMDAAGKSAAVDRLNQSLNLDPPLRGNESWEQIARVSGGAVGGLACNAIPGVGTVASPLCAMAGAYLGVKLEDWMGANLGDLEGWVSQNVSAVVSQIEDTVSGWLHDIF